MRMATRCSSMSVSSEHLPTAIATRPQFGSAPCTAVFTSGELTIDFATRRAWASSRAPLTVTVDQLGGALAVARELAGQVQADRTDGGSSRPTSTGPAGAVGEHRGGVGGGGVGVDRQRVEGPLDHPAEQGVQRAGGHGGVGEEERQHRRHVRLDHADALGDADDGGAPTGRARHLRDGVGGHDPPGGGQGIASPSSGGASGARPARTRSIG